MKTKKLIQCLAIVLIVAMTFTTIYACEMENVSHSESSDSVDSLYISGSGEVSHVSNTSMVDGQFHVDTLKLHI